ncbi:MAG TPA: CAP domain-containing protein [Acidimicrobiales bacterium]|nr:CAP domain-containing protein [Acidimicrobiales bacterium]
MPSPRARRNPRRTLTRLVGAPCLVATTAGLAVALTPQVAQASTYTDASVVVNTINADRAWFHLAPLSVSPALSSYAMQHAQSMAAAGGIFHSASLLYVGAVVPGWSRLGENVGAGPNVAAVENAFNHSPEHLSNMLGAYDVVGIGVAYSGAYVYITEEFAEVPL